MNFNFLAENSLTFYPVLKNSSMGNIMDTFSCSEEQLQQLQISLESFNEYSKSFGTLLAVESEKSLMQFQALLIMYMHCTNTKLRKRKRSGMTTFYCYCKSKTIKNLSYYNGPCNFSIKVEKTEKKDQLRIIETNLEHNHVMLPKSLYLELIFKASMFHLKPHIKQYLQSYLASDNGMKKHDDNVIFVSNNGKRPRDLEAVVSLYAKEVSPKCILDSLLKSKGSFNHETKHLLEALEDKNNQGLNKQFKNLVNDIKRKMIIADS